MLILDDRVGIKIFLTKIIKSDCSFDQIVNKEHLKLKTKWVPIYIYTYVWILNEDLEDEGQSQIDGLERNWRLQLETATKIN